MASSACAKRWALRGFDAAKRSSASLNDSSSEILSRSSLRDGEREGRVMEYRPCVAARHGLQRLCEALGASRIRRSEALLCILERFLQRNIEQVEVNHCALPARSIRAQRGRWRASMALVMDLRGIQRNEQPTIR